MGQSIYDKCEHDATRAAGAAAGQYLDQINKTDLASLTEQEWDAFCSRMISAYRSQLAFQVAQAHALATGADAIPY